MSRYLVDTAPILGAGVGHPDTELIRMYPILGGGFSARRTGRYQIAEGGKVQHWCELGPHGDGGEDRPRPTGYVRMADDMPIDGYGWAAGGRKRRPAGTGSVRYEKHRWVAVEPRTNGVKIGQRLGHFDTREEAEAALDKHLGETVVF